MGLTLKARDLSFKTVAAWTLDRETAWTLDRETAWSLDRETEHALNKIIYHNFYLDKLFFVQGQISFGNSEPTIDDKACTTPFQKE